MRRMTYFVMALALLLGLAQCRKEQPQLQSEGVRITLNVENGGASTNSATDGAKAEVVPPGVNFVEGDTILVASNGKYVGYLVHNGTTFTGNITDPVVGEPLYFYFLGNKIKVSTLTAGTTNECTVNISNQTGYPTLPVISMGVSIDRSNHNAIVDYSSGTTHYEAQLHNKASLMKFNVTTPTNSPICITGMNNQVTVNFNALSENDGFSYGKADANGVIMMKGGAGTDIEKWAIVLSQDALTETGTAYSKDQNYTGTRPTIHAIEANKYYHEGADVINMEVSTPNPEGSLFTPLTFEAITTNATVTFTKGSSFSGTVQYSTDGSTWSDYESAITLAKAGNKVMFRGNNSAYYNGSASKFSCSGDCYIYGNIMSLVSSENYPTATTVNDHAFREMFKENSNIMSHSTKDLILPATTLEGNCYAYMFQHCKGLTTPPVILAETLNGSNCCAGIFEDCTSLTSIPELHVTNLVNTCFKNMFKDCTNLSGVPSDYLPYTTLKDYCYEGMFQGCTKLTSVPNLPAPSLIKGCYKNMFNGCTSLTSVTCYATDISAENCTQSWLNSVGASGTLTTPSSTPWVSNSVNGIPNGWTRVNVQ